ncbi:MAG TPA: hypothetical protein VN841_16605 [Bryobacteraceae bacterium]|nr:hypothetical protein [Bryobacteraceae bacterium]
MPNLAAMLAAVTLIYCLFVFGGGERLFRDSDSGWHIRNGEWIIAQHELPRTDPYSFSKSGQPWLAWEWGADAVMGGLHRADGLRGVASLFAVVIAACMWMWCRLNFAAGGDFFLTALLAAPAITTASLHWLARPHVFGWLFALGAVWCAERVSSRVERVRTSPAVLLAIAAFTALWSNVHGSFLLAPAIALVYGAGHLARPLVWDLDPGPEWRKARWFFLAAGAALAGSLANPYGWHLHAHIFSYLRDEDLTSRIAEFQSFNFHDPDAIQVTLAMLVAACGAAVALSQKKLAQAVLMGALVWGGLRSARVIPLAALLALPLANGAITAALAAALGAARGLQPALAQRLRRLLKYSAGMRRIDARLSGAGFLAIVVFFSLVALRAPANTRGIGFSVTRFPVAAAQAVEQLPADARILAPDSYGGYLIYRFNGARKVYFDGRSDFYGAAFMKQYLTLIQARPGWSDIVNAYGFTHALLSEDSALKAALEQAGWTVMHRDETATLLERPRALGN